MITIINYKLDVSNIKLITSILPIVLLVYFYRMGDLYFMLLWPIAGLYAYGMVLNNKALSQVWFWILISITMIIPMILNWLEPANHHFVMSYLVMAIAISVSNSVELRDFAVKGDYSIYHYHIIYSGSFTENDIPSVYIRRVYHLFKHGRGLFQTHLSNIRGVNNSIRKQ